MFDIRSINGQSKLKTQNGKFNAPYRILTYHILDVAKEDNGREFILIHQRDVLELDRDERPHLFLVVLKEPAAEEEDRPNKGSGFTMLHKRMFSAPNDLSLPIFTASSS